MQRSILAVLITISVASAPALLRSRQESSAPDTRETQILEASHFVERDGQRIHIWQRVAADYDKVHGAQRRAVVFVHGATYSGRPDFDLQVRDYSVMEAFARAGWNTFAVDMQGYGASDDPVDGNWCHARGAALDLAAAVEWICSEQGVSRVSLLGWSWGCQISGEYAQAHPERVDRLILQGALYRTKYPFPAFAERFRTNDAEGAASDFIDGCFEEDVVRQYVAECLKHDPDSPNGSLRDFTEGSDQILKPAQLKMPTMLILGEHEVTPKQMADVSAFFAELAAHHKRFLILPGGGHAIFLEKPHVQWQREVRHFFEQDWD